jgi:proliferating cell nuclear antigen PCNA
MIFHAKTNEGYIIKILIELLQQVIKTACFELNHKGIFLRMMDSQRKILVDIELDANHFNIFEIKEPMYVGLNLMHLYRMLKSIKKKDSLVLRIDSDNASQLQLIVHPQDNNRMTKSFIQIQNIQNITVDLPMAYDHPVIISSNEYQRALKDMNSINQNIQVQLRKHSFYLSSVAENVFSRTVQFGELDDETDMLYDEQFEMEQFIRILKVAGLSKILHVYGSKDLPLRIKAQVGQLGKISIYMKSKNQIKKNK